MFFTYRPLRGAFATFVRFGANTRSTYLLAIGALSVAVTVCVTVWFSSGEVADGQIDDNATNTTWTELDLPYHPPSPPEYDSIDFSRISTDPVPGETPHLAETIPNTDSSNTASPTTSSRSRSPIGGESSVESAAEEPGVDDEGRSSTGADADTDTDTDDVTSNETIDGGGSAMPSDGRPGDGRPGDGMPSDATPGDATPDEVITDNSTDGAGETNGADEKNDAGETNSAGETGRTQPGTGDASGDGDASGTVDGGGVSEGSSTGTGEDEELFFATCAEAYEADAAPIAEGEPGYRLQLDRDRDGIACELNLDL